MRQIDDADWDKLEELLNRVANEREQDSDGPGSTPTNNSYAAQKMIKKLNMMRRKPPGLI